jgi:ribosome recycling factor
VKERIADARRRMDGAVKAVGNEFATVRTGRASTALLDRIHVDAYGTELPLNQVATVTTPDARLIAVQPFDKSLIQAVEKAIQESDLGLTPNNDGSTIRLPIPELSEERRKDLVKVAGRIAEDGRIAVRNVRRDVLNDLKRTEKEGEISQNDLSRAQDEVQKLTDSHVGEIDQLLKGKEGEILEI